MNNVDGTRWYVVQTQVNGEARAAQNLLRQGYQVYVPRYLKRRRHARKVDFIAKPLFPRYIFVAIDVTAHRWRSIQSTFGVSRLVTNGDDPAMVPDGVISTIQAREDEKGFIRLDSRPAFAPGDKVRVLAGAFMDSAGLFNGIADNDRVSILLDMLGRKVRVLLNAELVAAA
ncbi:transcriptional activator RfaH [Methylocystis sp. B8]|uniref:transcription termination/antitermination protein NusG n=1 Tax=Methylocystis sp. B8 TaxID=544938 RepID=UPI0010FF50C3|nr:transcriptional activator RfaH [Methylocystis sp. B8]TLG77595.1 transcriptional activator RfaH [Methylocystis sp. B8]